MNTIKKMLLLSAFAMLAAFTQAQTDVTAQYITNPGFEDCEALAVNTVHDNLADTDVQVANCYGDYSTALGTDYADNGWQLVEPVKSANGGVIDYSTTDRVWYSKWSTAGDPSPEAGPDGTTGTKGLCFAGTKSVVYRQSEAITLPAGSYTLTVNVWARNGATSNVKDVIDVHNIRTGFMPEGGSDDDLIPAMRNSQNFASNKWDTDVLTIELTEATTGRFQLSYGNSYFVVVDDLKLEYAGGVVTSGLAAVVKSAQALNNTLSDETLAAAIAAAQAFIANPTSQEDVATETEKLYTAMNTALAATTQPVNITAAYLENASFETGKIEPWAWGSTSGSIGEPINELSKPFIDGKNVVEFTTAGSNSFSYTIGHLPAGYYAVDAKLNQKATLKVGTSSTQLQGGKDYLYLRVHPAPFSLAAGGELTVSASSSAAFRADDFRLFYGKDAASLEALMLQAMKADATDILAMTEFASLTGSERAALSAAIEGTDADAITTAANNFVTALDSYEALAKSKTAAAAYNETDYPYANKDFYAEIQSLITTDATSASEAASLKAQLDELCFLYYVSNSYCEGVEGATDCTASIGDANATEAASAFAMQNMTIRTDKTGWKNPKTNETDKVVYGVTAGYYSSSNGVASIMKQTLKNLKAGKYVLSMTMMGSSNLDVNVFFNSEYIGTMTASGTIGGGKYGAGWNDYVITFDKADDSDMPLQLQAKPSANYHEWYIDNFRLYLLPDEVTPEPGEKCATPVIAVEDGRLTFSCDTEGAEFVSKVTADEAADYEGSEVTITGKYTVTVYAKKEGFKNSDTATLTFTVGSSGEICDVNRDGAVDVADISTIIDKMAGK